MFKFKQCLYLTQIIKQIVKLWKIDPFCHSMPENRQFECGARKLKMDWM